MGNRNPPHAETVEQEPSPPDAPPEGAAAEARLQRQIVVWAVAIGAVALIGIIVAVYLLLLPSTDTARIRDVFIIAMAFESLIIGLSLIILMIQLARLINLLQNEIKPILDSSQQTLNTLRGTTLFLSDNLVEPVVKLNEFLAAMRTMLGFFRLGRRK